MQSVFLNITIGFQLFLIFGYLFFVIFRTYPTGDDRISLMQWITGLIGILTFGLIGSLALVFSRMPIIDVGIAFALSFADVLGLYLLVDDTLKAKKQARSSQVEV